MNDRKFTFDILDEPGKPLRLVVNHDGQQIAEEPISMGNAYQLAGRLLNAIGTRVDVDALIEGGIQHDKKFPMPPTVQ